MTSRLLLGKFTALQVYEATVQAIAMQNIENKNRPAGHFFAKSFLENFDPTIYPHVCIMNCRPMVTSCNGKSDDDGDEDGRDPHTKQTRFSVNWSFPVTIEVMSGSAKFPLPPGPTRLQIEIMMPSGKLTGSSSHSVPQTPTKNAKTSPPVAASWNEYIAAANVLINEVVREALPNSHYLGFNPQQASRGSSMTISIEDDEVNELGIHIEGPHTHGWGTYKRKTKEWSQLRHKHCARERGGEGRDLGILYDGFNDGKFCNDEKEKRDDE